MGTVCVEIAVRDDPRLPLAVHSVAAQSRRPDRILLAASPATPPPLLEAARVAAGAVPVSVVVVAGGVVAARAEAQRHIDEATTVFLDSDEEAPPEWLAALVAPVEAGGATFAGGPTRPTHAPRNGIERYMDLLERSIYEDLVPSRVTYLPLQNSAWRSETVRSLGFDPRIPFAEDHDLEVRAVRAGGRGTFVPEAWVSHDPGRETSYYRWARKRYRYLVAMTMSLAKNGELGARLRERRAPVRHPLRFVELLLKPIAYVHGRLRWARVAGDARAPPA
jgi:GT2 family glycosyltransferase